ncbi:MAG TPA: hypothetical protein VGQ68_04000 [Gaiellaceae bacterium]|nr:hypothetical protein [Gaiellaceae bacterium]
MPKVPPWHDVDHDDHHDNTECIAGESIAPDRRQPGDGGKPLCRICARLNHAEAEAARP